jgi:predicted GIY-YIG superfamily endonuclease
MKNQSADEIYIYVLQLENRKYYVGQSNDLERRLKDHYSATRGSEWTRLHRPIGFIKVIPTGFHDPKMAMKYENEVTFECIKEYGWSNVRGGDYTNPDDITHLLGLIKDSGLGNEVCPVKVQDGIDVLNYERCVYTLQLEGGHYFVSTTSNLNMAILSEWTERGSHWTKCFKPMKLIRVMPVKNVEEYETLHLQELKRAFLEYHYSWVRGGIFNKIHEASHREMVFEVMGIGGEMNHFSNSSLISGYFRKNSLACSLVLNRCTK